MKYVFKKKSYIFLIHILDGLGFVVFKLFRKSPPPPRRDVGSFLVVRLDHLGDVLTVTGIPKVLKENFPQARVVFLTSSWGAALLEHNPFVDEILIFDAPWFSKKRYATHPRSLSFSGLLRQLSAKRIDVGLSLRGDLRENFILWFARIAHRIGYGITGGGFFLTKTVNYRRAIHETGHSAELLKVLGVSTDRILPALYFTDEEKRSVETKFPETGRATGEAWVGFLIEAGSRAKEWPLENALQFVGEFRQRFPKHRLILVGTDARKAEILKQRASDAVIDFAGRTTLREMCLLIQRCDSFIGADSGPTHVAAALGVPTVFLYSGTNLFAQWRPLTENAVVLRQVVPCSPCALEECNVPGHPCMAGIKPQHVLEALERP
jgi:ADP-heptose:LPS heptosyltransferase